MGLLFGSVCQKPTQIPERNSGENLGAGKIHSARAFQSLVGGGAPLGGAEPKRKDTPKRVFPFVIVRHYRCH